jgi:hypothetical protein
VRLAGVDILPEQDNVGLAGTGFKKAWDSPIIISYCRPKPEGTGKLNRINRLSRLVIEETKYNQRMSMADA